jgi:hypothetical protein
VPEAGVPSDWLDACVLDGGLSGDPTFAVSFVGGAPLGGDPRPLAERRREPLWRLGEEALAGMSRWTLRAIIIPGESTVEYLSRGCGGTWTLRSQTAIRVLVNVSGLSSVRGSQLEVLLSPR